ncbi:MAG: ATP-binding protein [Candidatus Sumerlaeaceae bacterium]|nr:ATP-binding protein [Candidatus Sumerlaeaceae bacterium]
MCEACNGDGFIINANGEACSCRCVAAFEAAQRRIRARIPKRYASASLDALAAVDSRQEKVIEAARAYCRSFTRSTDRGFLLYGPAGTGKTLIVAAVANNLLDRGVEVRFWNFRDLMAEERAWYNAPLGERTCTSPIQDARRCAVLVLDDILCEAQGNDFTRTAFEVLINARYEDMLPLLATTNVAKRLNGQEYWPVAFGDRVSSRLHEMCEIASTIGITDQRLPR